MCEIKCAKCGEVKNETEFHKTKNKTGRHCWCKICANKNAAKWYQDRKDNKEFKRQINERNIRKKRRLQQVVADLKAELGCCICGENEPVCLDFHHKNGEKDTNVSNFVVLKTVKRLVTEITKCVCVCSNCHRKIHANVLDCPDFVLREEMVVQKFEDFLTKKRAFVKPKKEKSIKSRSFPRFDIRKVVRPEKEMLEKMVWEMPTTMIAGKYGVSDKAIEKWCKSCGISKPPRGYWMQIKSKKKGD